MRVLLDTVIWWSIAGLCRRWLVSLIFNFTLGLIGALFVFLAKLWGVISAYSPDPATVRAAPPPLRMPRACRALRCFRQVDL